MIGNLNRAKRQKKIIRSGAKKNIIKPKELKNILRKNIKLNALPLIATRDKKGLF
ncbi:hypothetical protein O7047_05945 [Pseudenterobacter timonensis]|uniref:Uncharacterized protein n=1 Tax=Pseudenterobacter timonensis TaxID=1755099 RepID=A0AAE4DL25_9ENTR|nr:hypothetical protein [Pseudenterobacter timonensis]MDR9889775.1 hypothetical protein [Pseudenterobacter timonensis]